MNGKRAKAIRAIVDNTAETTYYQTNKRRKVIKDLAGEVVAIHHTATLVVVPSCFRGEYQTLKAMYKARRAA